MTRIDENLAAAPFAARAQAHGERNEHAPIVRAPTLDAMMGEAAR